MTSVDRTPVLVGAGQTVEREATLNSPMQLASQAALRALADSGGTGVAAAIDTIAVVRLFSDSTKMWSCPFGRSNNPPESIARVVGANPAHRIYSQMGGNQPLSLIIEFARDIARGEKSAVLLAGSEAIRNQRTAERQGLAPDWNEEFDAPLEDRGFGPMVATNQERKNGLILPMFYYVLIDQARRHRLGVSVEQYRQRCAKLLEAFSAIAAGNPYSQFPGSLSAQDILSASPLTHLYSKRMIAQDGINQGAAVMLCSVAKARELGIPEDRYVYLHGMAEGLETELSRRVDPSRSDMAGLVVDRALDMAGTSAGSIDLIDIYSCFPCAVTTLADHLGLPDDGSKSLTLTGGLPYFGGPGNNYSMHGVAEMIWRLREDPEAYGLVTTNGGVLSKHASGVCSRKPSQVDWSQADTSVSDTAIERREIIAAPAEGRVLSYSVNYAGEDARQGIVLAETEDARRFVACTAAEDLQTVQTMLNKDPTNRTIRVEPPHKETLHFELGPLNTT